MPPKKLDAEKCKEFAKNPSVNPLTGRAIDPAGATAKAIAKDCEKLGASASAAGPSRPAAPPAPAAVPFEVNDYLRGKHIVFSGFRSKEYADLLATVGCVVGDSVTKATIFVVAADPEEKSGKLDKARNMKVPILSREQFEKGYLLPQASLSPGASSSVAKSSSLSSHAAKSSSSSPSSSKKAEIGRAKIAPEVDKLSKAYSPYYYGTGALMDLADTLQLNEKTTYLINRIGNLTEEINDLFSELTVEVNAAVEPENLSHIPVLAEKPGGKKRDPTIWKYSFDRNRDFTSGVYLRKLLKKNAKVIVPGDAFVSVKTKYNDPVYFVNEGKTATVAEYQQKDNVASVPFWLTKILLKTGKPIHEIAELYGKVPIRYVIYPMRDQDKLGDEELLVYNAKSKKDEYVSLDDGEFYTNFYGMEQES